MQSKLGLDFKKVERAKSLAKDIANEVQAFVESKTTVAVERTLCRLMGIDGVDENQVPLPNVVQEEKGMTEDEMAGWHHQLDGHEFEQTLEDGEGQGSLACCNTWSRTELGRTERLNN